MTNINLPVPFFTQRDNTYVWYYKHEEDIVIKKVLYKKGSFVADAEGKEISKKIWDYSCNITCLAMVLNYLGVTKDSPYQMCEKIFADDYPINPSKEKDFDRYITYRKGKFSEDKGFRCIENISILGEIAKDIYSVRNVYISENGYSLDDVKKEVESGYPVIVNCGITRPSKVWMQEQRDENTSYNTQSLGEELIVANNDANYESHGHYIVIRGFTGAGDIIINDPWGKATNNAGDIPTERINDKEEDTWAAYNTNIYNGSNCGENIVIKESDFKRQYTNTFYSAIIIYDRRWSFPFKDCLTNQIKIDEGSQKRYVPDPVQVEACYRLQTAGVYYPITSTCKPHNGIHINNGKYTPFYSIGSGMLVAAKLCNKKGETIENGSNCFILVKHQIQLPQREAGCTEVKSFFCLYNHIRPIQFADEDFSKIRFLNGLNNERNKDREKKSFFDSDNENNSTNVLQEEAKEKIDKLMSGETVIFNDRKIISEICEGDYLGQTDSRGGVFHSSKKLYALGDI